MKTLKKTKKSILTPVSVTCDKCGKTYDYEDDVLETQEFLNIDFVGGYSSVFGDMVRVECDICQHCLKNMIGGFCKTQNVGY